MIEQVPSLYQLIRRLSQVPCLASRNVYRVATYFMRMDKAQLEQFCAILVNARENVIPCPCCFAWQERGKACVFCNDQRRDPAIICVVETWQELLSIEKTGGYSGVYHVLGGAICPLEGIGSEDLTIEPLLRRVDGSIKEVILALNQTPEGEATAAFIAQKLKVKQVSISCLARGVPVGSVLETMDRLTLFKALHERRPF